ncbi:MAG TPA: hypothetical protein VEA99_00075 [Gemmatimonadaceae bacterium]|nr:hypothetical protein [Gemmatimonadaceae bacterium]
MGDAGHVQVELGRPLPDGQGGVWVCGVRVTSQHRVLERAAVGVDALNALRVAVQMIRQEIVDELPRMHGVTLTWHGRDAVEGLPNQFRDETRPLHRARKRAAIRAATRPALLPT